MPTTMLGIITLSGLAVVAVLLIFLRKRHGDDMLAAIMNSRRGASKVVTKGDYVDGMEHIQVALALDDSMFHYENSDMKAFIEIARIDEVEYDTELATGKDVEQSKVLRLRTHGQAFEFILDKTDVERWISAFPPHRLGEEAMVR
ncbi:MAG TPA: hypothetical protein VHL58_08645 [Thermoanaerobaculia bacterium]|nr:hypothetical protein [Thermoanaerobaculia bacterium]